MEFVETPGGLCKKTFEMAKSLRPDEIVAVMDRYCRRDAAFLCDKKFGFKLHQPTLEWLIADNAVIDFLE